MDEHWTDSDPEAFRTTGAAQPTGAASRANPRLLWGCAALIVALAIFAAGGLLGFTYGRFAATGSALASLGASSGEDQRLRAELSDEFGIFWEAMDVLYGNYYGALPEGVDGAYAAVRGVVRELDDPHTSFYTPEEAEVFRESLSGAFEGIGARVEWDDDADTVRIVEPFENQPAWNAGIRRGDWIVAVDDQSVVGTDLNSAVARIRGPKGTTVRLSLVRLDENGNQPFDVDVVRDRIETPTVTTEHLGEEGRVGYVRLYSFNENSGSLLKQGIEDVVQRGSQGLILDLRGNTGGLLREAVKVTSLFLDDSVVLYERFKDGREETYRTSGSPVATEIPLVVLVNEGSASASEIVAGALQDADRATLVGATTFGKGSVQIPESLDDGSILRVTIARWYTPANRTIDGVGLTPDVETALTDEDREAGRDPQLERALEIVEKMLAGEPTQEPDSQPAAATAEPSPAP